MKTLLHLLAFIAIAGLAISGAAEVAGHPFARTLTPETMLAWMAVTSVILIPFHEYSRRPRHFQVRVAAPRHTLTALPVRAPRALKVRRTPVAVA
jgi:hypothetical protein